jgi:Xaa-Pro dipeptidase
VELSAAVHPAALLNVERARAVLANEGVDALLAGTLENVYYVSGVWSENFEILPRRTQLFAVVAGDELERARVISGVEEAANIYDAVGTAVDVFYAGRFVRYHEDGTPLEGLSAYVKDHVVDGTSYPTLIEGTAAAVRAGGLSSATIAYDERGIFPENLARIRAALPDARLVPGSELFRRIRAVKTPEEQRRLRRAAEITETAIAAAIGIVREGVLEAELIEEFEHCVLREGARPSFCQIAFGERGATGYVMRRRAPLVRGEVIRFDVGCAFEGYQSDIARNVCLGPPNARAAAIHAALVAGEEAAAAAARPGTTARDVFGAGVEAVRAAGLTGYDRTHIGHGLGLDVYDAPLLSASDETPMEPGMVVAIETPYYELGFAGLHPEDPVLVMPGGGEFLTRSRGRLEVVDG